MRVALFFPQLLHLHALTDKIHRLRLYPAHLAFVVVHPHGDVLPAVPVDVAMRPSPAILRMVAGDRPMTLPAITKLHASP